LFLSHPGHTSTITYTKNSCCKVQLLIHVTRQYCGTLTHVFLLQVFSVTLALPLSLLRDHRGEAILYQLLKIFLVVLGFELWASCLVGRHSITWATLLAHQLLLR
jgi:hypothetical protein